MHTPIRPYYLVSVASMFLISCATVHELEVDPREEQSLVDMLSSDNPGARVLAAWLLLPHQPKTYTPLICKQAIVEEQGIVVIQMVRALGRWGTAEALTTLESLRNDNRHAEVTIVGPDGQRNTVHLSVSDEAASAFRSIRERHRE
jgi:hypothetical protein